MRWSERIKLTFETFKRVALPLYGWYLIFAFAGMALIIAAMIPFFVITMRTGSLHNGFVPPFSGTFPNPNPPMPPGGGLPGPFPRGLAPFGYNMTPFLTQAPIFFIVFAVIILFFWLATSAFMTGMFNLTQKGMHEKVLFRDFRFTGTSRILGWYGILTLVSILLLGAGIFGALALRGIDYASPIFGGLYVLILVALGIILAPWLSTSAFYMLHHRELSFGRALRGSWNFYRRHMGSLWLFFLTMVGIQLLLSFFNQTFHSVGLAFLLSLIVGPFTAILPIVWVLSLEDEDHPQISNSYPTPPLTEPSTQPSTEPSPLSNPLPIPSIPSHPLPPEDLPLPEQLTPLPQNESPQETNQEMSQETDQDMSREISREPVKETRNNIPPETTDSVNFCPTCGRQTRPGANYCAQCGTKL